jgi:hypothetical protein
MSQKNLLLVEGNADKEFFNTLCNTIKLSPTVQVAPPKDLVGGSYNTKQGVFCHLKTLLPQLNDGQIQRLAIVVDADYAESHGLGLKGTLNQIKKIVSPFGFELPKSDTYPNGFYFKNSDGLADFGVWIMPDNGKDGMLEDWIKSCVTQSEQTLFDHAEKTVTDLLKHGFKKYKPTHITKIQVATWLAWQELPMYGVDRVLLDKNDPLVDKNSVLYKNLTNWLKKIYIDNP